MANQKKDKADAEVKPDADAKKKVVKKVTYTIGARTFKSEKEFKNFKAKIAKNKKAKEDAAQAKDPVE